MSLKFIIRKMNTETFTANTGDDLRKLYRVRFSSKEQERKEQIWKVLCKYFFQKWIPAEAEVLEIACGYGEFIRNISCKKKTAVDLNPDAAIFLGNSIKLLNVSAVDLSSIPSNSIDIIFSSNFFEHLETKLEMTKVLKEAYRILKVDGLYLALQPNLKFIREDYWNFYDHQLPLTHASAREGFEQVGFRIETLIDRFLPYTTKSAIPQSPLLVRAYLFFPLAWKILGKQFFLVARK